MASVAGAPTKNSKPADGFRIRPWDVISGIPAGVLIFMGTVLSTTLVSIRSAVPFFAPLVFLAVIAFGVGILAGISRLRQGPATGLMAGIYTALILAYLWFAARPGDEFNSLVIGAPGMITAVVFSPIGGWVGARLRKAI